MQSTVVHAGSVMRLYLDFQGAEVTTCQVCASGAAARGCACEWWGVLCVRADVARRGGGGLVSRRARHLCGTRTTHRPCTTPWQVAVRLQCSEQVLAATPRRGVDDTGAAAAERVPPTVTHSAETSADVVHLYTEALAGASALLNVPITAAPSFYSHLCTLHASVTRARLMPLRMLPRSRSVAAL